MSDTIGIDVPGATLGYWPGNPVELEVLWDVLDDAGGYVWTADAWRGDAYRPSSRWPAGVVVDDQTITITFDPADTGAWGPGTYWRLLRDDVTVLAGKTSRDVAGDLSTSSLTVELASPQAIAITIEDSVAGPAPSTQVDYAEITADLTGIVVDLFNIDLLSGLAVDIPDLATPVCVEGQAIFSHTVANATVHPMLCRTSPAPATVLDSIGTWGSVALSAIGSKANGRPFALLQPHTPCTVQMYLSGTGGTVVVSAQTYARAFIRAWSV